MKKLVLVSLLIANAFLLNVKAQNNVGIGTTTPNASAALDVTATDKGLLLPRVALSSTTVAAPVTSPATGLLVYNTATAGTAPNNVIPGFYYWNGTKWVQVGAGSAAPSCVKLDEAYDCGGAGAGRTITADAGAVQINVASSVSPTTTNRGLYVTIANGNTANPTGGVYVTHSGAQGAAFFGEVTNTANQYSAIQGVTSSNAANVSAVSGFYTGAGAGYGIWGENNSSTAGSQGLMGMNHRTTGGWGVEGSGYNGVYGRTIRQDGIGIRGENNSGYNGSDLRYGVAISGYGSVGARGESQNVDGAGVFGLNVAPVFSAGSDMSAGVWGHSNNGCGLAGFAGTSNAIGLYVEGGGVVDNFYAGNLAKGAGSFKIDHPLDPQNKYLYHSFVESPDMLNIYNGNVVLNSNGTAVITLPSYFDALNMDVKYQLTAIGGSMPNLYISKEVNNGKFEIAGGIPNGKVSWQVTGIRQDPYANANRIIPEVEKEDINKGKYLNPEVYGRSSEKGINKRFSKAMKEKSNVESIMELKK